MTSKIPIMHLIVFHCGVKQSLTISDSVCEVLSKLMILLEVQDGEGKSSPCSVFISPLFSFLKETLYVCLYVVGLCEVCLFAVGYAYCLMILERILREAISSSQPLQLSGRRAWQLQL